MKLVFKNIELDKLPEILKLFKEKAELLKMKGETQWRQWLNPTETDIDWLRDGFLKKEFYFVYNDENVLIGMFRYLKEDKVYWTEQDENARYVHSLLVKNEFSNLGLGTMILNEIENKMKSEGITKFRLDCNISNQFLVNYYQSKGFSEVGIFKKNETDSFCLMEKKLV